MPDTAPAQEPQAERPESTRGYGPLSPEMEARRAQYGQMWHRATGIRPGEPTTCAACGGRGRLRGDLIAAGLPEHPERMYLAVLCGRCRASLERRPDGSPALARLQRTCR